MVSQAFICIFAMVAYASAGILLDGGSGGGWDGGASSGGGWDSGAGGYSAGWDSGAGGYSGGWDGGAGGSSGGWDGGAPAEEEVQVVRVIQDSSHGHGHHAPAPAPVKIVKVNSHVLLFSD